MVSQIAIGLSGIGFNSESAPGVSDFQIEQSVLNWMRLIFEWNGKFPKKKKEGKSLEADAADEIDILPPSSPSSLFDSFFFFPFLFPWLSFLFFGSSHSVSSLSPLLFHSSTRIPPRFFFFVFLLLPFFFFFFFCSLFLSLKWPRWKAPRACVWLGKWPGSFTFPRKWCFIFLIYQLSPRMISTH